MRDVFAALLLVLAATLVVLCLGDPDVMDTLLAELEAR